MMVRIITILLLTFSFQQAGFGWGQTGHRVVGKIAEKYLSKRALNNINKILWPANLPMSGTWMDEIRSDTAYDYTYTWHWVTIPEGQSFDPDVQEPSGNAFTALQQIITALKSDTLSAQKEQEYLKMLVHLVGDIHQPLHVGTGQDRGGNDVRVDWMGNPSNLHRVWDSDLIDSKQLSYTELAHYLELRATPDLKKQWQAALPGQWLEEAMKLRSSLYDIPEDRKLGYQYLFHNFPLVEQQLLKAGIRLAGILNEIYG